MQNERIVGNKARLLGVVYTPPEIALSVSRHVIDKCRVATPKVLEPSVGDGNFLEALKFVLPTNTQVIAIDIDQSVISNLKARSLGGENNLTFLNSDFIHYAALSNSEKFDVIIGNPPFIKKNNYSKEFKTHLDSLSKLSDYPLKDLKNAWAAFVVASELLLSEKGILSFIVPYELMTVSYGQTLQSQLFSKFERVDVYIPDQKAFKEIEQDAIVFVAQKRTTEKLGVYIHRVRCLSDLTSISTQKVDFLSSKNLSLDLKAFLFGAETIELLHRLRAQCKKINDYCDSAPGIVTGANDFFILTKDEVQQKGLSSYAKRILKKGSFLPKSPLFTFDDFKSIEAQEEPCYLIDFKNTELSEAAIKYIRDGEHAGVQLGYKCKNRNKWYEVPILEPSDVLFFKRSHSFPRLCINEANVLVTDTAYQVKLKENVSRKALCFSFYNTLTLLFSEIDGRFYGGGVLELTPSEFKSLPLVYKEPSESEFQAFVTNHNKQGHYVDNIQSYGDGWLAKELNLTQSELALLQGALKVVRQHRMRHGQ